MKIKLDLININGLFFVIGMIGVYIVTNGNWWALFWCFVASIHITTSWLLPSVHYSKK